MPGNTVLSTCAVALSSLARRLVAFVRGLAFWAAILLPLLYVPLILVGYSPTTDLPVLGKLVTLNVAALVVGSGYDGTVCE